MQMQHTTKAGEAIQNAQKLAAESQHPELTPAHLAVSLLQAPEGVTNGVLAKLAVDPRVLAGELVLALDKLPRAEGSQLAPSRAFVETINTSADIARKLGDEYVSTEHLLLALARKGGPEVIGLFNARKLTPERIEAALEQVRGDKRVNSPDPEATYDTLKKYARDLTADAAAG
ncbi:MAG: Clp protease N-terminal domain-containing protein, partial [Planctomycetota bacterium]